LGSGDSGAPDPVPAASRESDRSEAVVPSRPDPTRGDDAVAGYRAPAPDVPPHARATAGQRRRRGALRVARRSDRTSRRTDLAGGSPRRPLPPHSAGTDERSIPSDLRKHRLRMPGPAGVNTMEGA